MFEYIKGLLTELSPTYAIIEANGIGYFINITVNTYSKLKKGQECKLFLHEILREDLHAIYGFENLSEREMFRKLITVNGVGANTARLILSSLSVNNVVQAINEENINVLKSVKGIGVKTAQRIVIELKDKLSDFDIQISQTSSSLNNTLQKDALNALTMLGFSKPNVEKVLIKLLKDNKEISLENLIKLALNYL